jgi:hypothetical protein
MPFFNTRERFSRQPASRVALAAGGDRYNSGYFRFSTNVATHQRRGQRPFGVVAGPMIFLFK